MVRKPNPLKGLSVNDLLSIPYEDVNALSRSELSRVVSRLSAVANKRLKRLEGAGYRRGEARGRDVISGTRKFKAAGKSMNQLRNEYARVSQFLEGKTSTLTGMRAVRNQFFERLADVTGSDIEEIRMFFDVSDYGDDLTTGQKFWRLVRQATDKGFFAESGYSSSQIQGAVYDLMSKHNNYSIIEMLNKLESMGRAGYEAGQEIEQSYREQDYTTL